MLISCFLFCFTGVKIGVESLPRSESSLLTVKLGGLFLRDLTTQGSVFPVLVSPKPVRFCPRLKLRCALELLSVCTENIGDKI